MDTAQVVEDRVRRADVMLNDPLQPGEAIRAALERVCTERAVGSGVGDAPVRDARRSAELGADLAHPVAQADHPVEMLAGEHIKGLGRLTGQVEAVVLAHHADRIGVQGLGMAAGAHRQVHFRRHAYSG